MKNLNQAEELSVLTNIEVALILTDGKRRIDSYFSSANLNNRLKPQLSNILYAEIVIPKVDVSCQTDIEDIRNQLSIKSKKKLT